MRGIILATLNTPAHLVINIAVLKGRAAAAALGAFLPDAPIFAFYLWEKLVLKRAESQIWSVDYFVSAWQPVIDSLHSFPLAAIGLAAAWRWGTGRAFCLSLLLHSALDFPLHHDDTHRHFFPFSDFRFASPVSYWDPRHHGRIGAGIEALAVVAAVAALWRRYPSRRLRAGLAVMAAAYVTGYLAFYAR